MIFIQSYSGEFRENFRLCLRNIKSIKPLIPIGRISSRKKVPNRFQGLYTLYGLFRLYVRSLFPGPDRLCHRDHFTETGEDTRTSRTHFKFYDLSFLSFFIPYGSPQDTSARRESLRSNQYTDK